MLIPDIHMLLNLAVEQKASDIHLTVAVPPVFRINGELVPLSLDMEGQLMPRLMGSELKGEDEEIQTLTREDVEDLVRQLMTEQQLKRFAEFGEVDFAYGVSGLGRFRINCFKQRGSPAVAIRVLNTRVPAITDLGLPDVLAHLARRPRGLVLVTGAAGSGKSTTLAAMVNLINRERRCHILTLEDPIEYLHRHNRSIVNQREIEDDTRSFATALRAALREDPDVIMVGEMRDLETTAITVTAAETGHLVLATMHTPNAALTIDRIIDVFPPHQQGQVRIQLAGALQGIIAQQLLPRADKKGRVVAVEVLIATPAVRNLIREGKTQQIPTLVQTGSRYGMISFDQSLKSLCTRGFITKEQMFSRVEDSEALLRGT
ncbi:MAG: type IV pilus twitching motility protein PilT [Bacillota bacterium]